MTTSEPAEVMGQRVSAVVQDAHNKFEQDCPYARAHTHGAFFVPVEAHQYVVESDDEGDHRHLEKMHDDYAQAKVAHSDHQPASPGNQADWTPSVVWHARIFLDDFSSNTHCTADGKLKARRATPHIKVSDLLNGLAKEDSTGDWVYQGQLNGWPAMTGFVLASITAKTTTMGAPSIKRLWKAVDKKPLPQVADIPLGCRATFLAPQWTSVGWSHDSPGFVFWFSEQHGREPRLLHGNAMRKQMKGDDQVLRDANVVNVLTFAHRYPKAHETPQDKMTYHTGVLLEWSHGKFFTVVELAYRNGVSGYGGKANWCEDKLSKEPKLFKCMVPGMVQPWDETKTEIRIFDVPARSRQEFEAYLQKYSNHSGLDLSEQRFLDPQVFADGELALRECTAVDVAGYVLNYASRVTKYDKMHTNCQTFAADLFAFLTGKRNVRPYSTVLQMQYKQRLLSFVYPDRSGKSVQSAPPSP